MGCFLLLFFTTYTDMTGSTHHFFLFFLPAEPHAKRPSTAEQVEHYKPEICKRAGGKFGSCDSACL